MNHEKINKDLSINVMDVGDFIKYLEVKNVLKNNKNANEANLCFDSLMDVKIKEQNLPVITSLSVIDFAEKVKDMCDIHNTLINGSENIAIITQKDLQNDLKSGINTIASKLQSSSRMK